MTTGDSSAFYCTKVRSTSLHLCAFFGPFLNQEICEMYVPTHKSHLSITHWSRNDLRNCHFWRKITLLFTVASPVSLRGWELRSPTLLQRFKHGGLTPTVSNARQAAALWSEAKAGHPNPENIPFWKQDVFSWLEQNVEKPPQCSYGISHDQSCPHDNTEQENIQAEKKSESWHISALSFNSSLYFCRQGRTVWETFVRNESRVREMSIVKKAKCSPLASNNNRCLFSRYHHQRRMEWSDSRNTSCSGIAIDDDKGEALHIVWPRTTCHLPKLNMITVSVNGSLRPWLCSSRTAETAGASQDILIDVICKLNRQGCAQSQQWCGRKCAHLELHTVPYQASTVSPTNSPVVTIPPESSVNGANVFSQSAMSLVHISSLIWAFSTKHKFRFFTILLFFSLCKQGLLCTFSRHAA